MDITTAAVVLAGGQGSRMLSGTPQVLHKVADLPMICHTLNTVLGRGWAPVVVVVNSSNEDAIKEVLTREFADTSITYERQQDGIGALQAAELGIQRLEEYEGNVMVIPANMPLLQPDTTLLCLEAMIAEGAAGSTAPYVGLVQRGSSKHYPVFCGSKSWLEQALSAVRGGVSGDADSSAASWIRDLQQTLPRISNDPDGDTLAHFASAGFGVNAASEDDLCVVATRADLATAEAVFRSRLIARHQAQGVTFRDPQGTFLGANVAIGRDTIIGVGVQIYGNTVLGERVRVEGPTSMTDSFIENGVFIRSFTVLEGTHVSEGSGAGPFARLREGTILGQNSYLGNFVETKNAKIGSHTLACHLAYLGDAEVGSHTNIGAGTITCNFNGASKNKTKIGDNVFVGSNSTLVAPVQICDTAIVAAGSTITESAPEGALAFGRARQIVKPEAAEKLREKLRTGSKK